MVKWNTGINAFKPLLFMSLNTCYVCTDVGKQIYCKFEHHSKELFIFEQLATAMVVNSPNTFTYCMYVYIHTVCLMLIY